MAPRTKREKRLFAITVVLVLGALIYLGVNAYREHIGNLQDVLGQYDARIAQQRAMLERNREIRDRFRKITGKLFLGDNEARVQIAIRQELDILLEQAGITSDWRMDPLPTDYYDELQIAVYRLKIHDLTTTVPAVARFLSELSSEGSLMEAEELELTHPGSKGGQESIRASIIVTRIVFLGGGTEEGEEA